MYSFSEDAEGARLSDEEVNGDSDRCHRFSGQNVDPALGFEENMRKLKEANERTLDLCNRLCYQESQDAPQEFDEEQEEYGACESDPDLEVQVQKPRAATSKSVPVFTVNSDSELLNKSVGSMQNILAKNAKDSVRDFSTADIALDNPKTSKGVRLDPRPRIRCFETSLSENDDSECERYREDRAVTTHNDTLQSAMTRIEDMWGTFTVDDYAPWQSTNVKRNQSLTNIDTNSKNNHSVVIPWKKKSTVADPPTMLIRDANKTPIKTKAMIELDQEREEKKHMEEMECKKQFRARAAPDHIRLRLVEEMGRQQEEKRRFLRENGEEILKSLQKPFEFIEREEQKKREKLKEMRQSTDRHSNGHFRARPFPAHIFNGTVEDKILEEEEYRRIRMRMRAEDLLNSSTVPYSMRVRDRRPRKPEMARKEESFRPQVNQTIPDLDEQYQRFMEQMIKRKEGKKPTTCKPFNLRLSNSTAPRKYTSPCRASLKLSRQRELEGHLSSSLEAIPTHLREEKRKSSGQRSKRKRMMDNAWNNTKWNVPPGNVNYSLDDSDVLLRSADSPNSLQSRSRNQTKASNQKQIYLDEGNERPALTNSSDPLNMTYDLNDSNVDRDASQNSPSDFWSHPSLVRRSEFWSNPVGSVH